MSFHCAHRGFAQAVNDPNWGYLGSGNVMSNTQSSTYLRAFTQTDCAGRKFPPGQLQEYDLAFFNGAMPRFIETEARRLSQDQDLILYRFFHWHQRGRIEHGCYRFFRRAISKNGFPDRVVIDKSGANQAGLNNINMSLLWNGWFWLIDVLQVKYLNNIIEQDHQFIKNLTKHMKVFKSFNSASATLEGIEVAHMIRKQQLGASGKSAFQQFAALAG